MSKIPDFQPLYRWVYKVLIARIVDLKWRHAGVLRQALAVELGISPGTVRQDLKPGLPASAPRNGLLVAAIHH